MAADLILAFIGKHVILLLSYHHPLTWFRVMARNTDFVLHFVAANIQSGSALVETVVVFLDASQEAQQAAQTFAAKVQDIPTFEIIYVPTVWGTASVSNVAVNEAQIDTCSTTSNCFLTGPTNNCACSEGNACVANAQGIGECRVSAAWAALQWP